MNAPADPAAQPGRSEPGRSEPGRSEPGRSEPGRSEPGAVAPDAGVHGPVASGPVASGPVAPGPAGPGPHPFPPGPAQSGQSPRRRRGRPRWLLGGVTVWLLVLLVVAIVSERRDRPTVPEQRDAVAAVRAVDRAAGVLLAAVGRDRVLVIGPLTIDPDCPVTPVRAGAAATRAITVHVSAGSAPEVLAAIGSALPAGYRPEVTHGRSGTVRLRADAGDFIAVRGTVSDGLITLRASSGCRPLDAAVPERPAATPGGELPPLERALAALGSNRAAAPATEVVACPDGTTARTVSVGDVPAPADLGRALNAATAGATVIEAGPDRYAYRVGDTSVVVTAVGGRARVAASTGCAATR